ncbi:MAG TPA: hypothetical protein V6C76_06930 [Drouetiella sp.]
MATVKRARRLLDLSFDKAYIAFINGDTDLARRLLLASCNHYTRERNESRDVLRLFWSLAWFAFDERRYAEAHKFFDRIRHMEEANPERSAKNLSHLRYLLAVTCESQEKYEEAEVHYQASLYLLKSIPAASVQTRLMINSCRDRNLRKIKVVEAAA